MQPAASLVFFYLMPVSLYLVARQVDFSVRAAAGLFATLALLGFYLASHRFVNSNSLPPAFFHVISLRQCTQNSWDEGEALYSILLAMACFCVRASSAV